VATPSLPRAGSLRRPEMRWWPLRLRTLARAYFAWLEHASTGRWAEAAVKRALELIEPGVHRAVITCGPPHRAHDAGRVVADRTGLPLVVDLRDPWSLVQRLPEAIASPVWLRLAERHERRVVARASLIVANTEPHADALRRAYPAAAERVIAVPNGCDDEPIPAPAGRTRFLVAYAGTIYLDRDPRPLFRAAARLVQALHLTPRDFGIELMGEVAEFDGMPLDQLARAEGVAEFVELYPPAPRAEALQFLARAAVLIVLPQDSSLAVPAKVYEYLEFDAWLLALAEPGSAVERLLRGSGADVAAPSDDGAIAAILRRRY